MIFVYPRAAVMLSPKKATVSPSWSKNASARRCGCGERQAHAPTAMYKTQQVFFRRIGIIAAFGLDNRFDEQTPEAFLAEIEPELTRAIGITFQIEKGIAIQLGRNP